MNAIDSPQVFFRSLATRGSVAEVPSCLPLPDRGLPGGRLRPRHRRDPRHRAGRRRRGRRRRRLALRDDARVRCRLPAREDRHAGARRRGRHQQVRPAGRRRRPAGRVPAVATRPSAVAGGRRGAAGLRHDRLPIQRRRRHRPVPAPAATVSSADGLCGARRPRCPGRRPARRPRATGDRPLRAPPVPGRDRRHRARLPRPHGRAVHRGEACPAGGRDRRAGRRARDRRRRRARTWPNRCAPSCDPDTPGGCLESGRRLGRRSPPNDGAGRRSRDSSALAGTGPGPPRGALPRFTDHGDLLRWLRSENLPGRFPFTAGVFPFKREEEDPARMFAGEGDAFRTNRRFHLLADGQPATRLSTAFDSVTLYGFDPDERPDIYGKIGHLGGLHRHPRRHEGPLRRVRPLRPDHLGVDDHQRAGPDHPGHVPQHRHRPAARPLRRPSTAGRRRPRRPPRSRPACSGPSGARSRPTS